MRIEQEFAEEMKFIDLIFLLGNTNFISLGFTVILNLISLACLNLTMETCVKFVQS